MIDFKDLYCDFALNPGFSSSNKYNVPYFMTYREIDFISKPPAVDQFLNEQWCLAWFDLKKAIYNFSGRGNLGCHQLFDIAIAVANEHKLVVR